MSLQNAKVGDKIRVHGTSIYVRGEINEVRTIVRALKHWVVDDKGSRWTRNFGFPVGGSPYPTVFAYLCTESQPEG